MYRMEAVAESGRKERGGTVEAVSREDNFQVRIGTENKTFSLFSWPTSMIGRLSSLPVLSTCPLHTDTGCGKEMRILIGPW